MFVEGGTGSNELLTLVEVAERFELVGHARADRAVLRRLRRLEHDTGRHLLVATGEGKGRRYLVLGRELDAALEGEERVNVTSIADRIAAAVQRIEARIERVSVGLDALTRRVERLETGAAR